MSCKHDWHECEAKRGGNEVRCRICWELYSGDEMLRDLSALRARAEKAERERDEAYARGLAPARTYRERAEAAEARVRELEAAMRKVEHWGSEGISEDCCAVCLGHSPNFDDLPVAHDARCPVGAALDAGGREKPQDP